MSGCGDESGCGKATLALALLNLLSALLALNPVLRVSDQVSEVIRAHSNRESASQTPELLFRLVGLPDERHPSRVSSSD